MGVDKTVQKCKERFFWYGLAKFVQTFLQCCQVCQQRSNKSLSGIAQLENVRSGYPFERIGIDIVGPLPVTEHNSRYIRVARDYFTRWTEAYPLVDVRAGIGPLPVTEHNSRYIWVARDYFTRWTEAYPLEDVRAVTVADVFVREWVCRFGAPVHLNSDQGPQFTSLLFKEMCRKLGIVKTQTTPYHPQSNGLTERVNKTLVNALQTAV